MNKDKEWFDALPQHGVERSCFSGSEKFLSKAFRISETP
jgi:hypothetical protein